VENSNKFNYEKEEWRDIPGFEGIYRVSDLGRVMSLRNKRGLGDMVLKSQGAPYLHVGLWIDGAPKMRKVHSLVALAFLGPKSKGLCVNHKDGNKFNNSLSNLEYCTQSENIQHSYDMGLHVKTRRGESHQFAKIKNSDIPEIKHMKAEGFTHREIAARFGIDKSGISRILSGKIWRSVK
jgi:hypothetical protein